MNMVCFSENENLEDIIKKNINEKIESISKISTGWTNIVLDIKTNNDSYIAKLPRDEFWTNQIIKDSVISNFVRNNLGICTGDMKIYYDNNRPLSIHKKIEGNSLTERIKFLSKDKICNITKQLANIFYKFHNFNYKNHDEIKYEYCDFIISMTKIDEKNYNMEYFKEMLEDNKDINKKVFIHGDLNIGNIILNKNDDIEAIIDYSFAGLGDIYTDLSIISCRVDDFFFDSLIREYENISNIQLNKNKLKNRVDLRQHIEDTYIAFMKKFHPEVSI